MPTYEYACNECGHALEVFQRMSDDPLTMCPECEQPSLKRKIGRGAGIIFKGSGFYETDFKEKRGTKDSEESGKEKSSDAKESKSESQKSSTDSGEKKSAGVST